MLAWYCGTAHREGRRVEEDQEEERGERSSTAQQEQLAAWLFVFGHVCELVIEYILTRHLLHMEL